MLVLDATLSKQDAQAINEFVDIARKQERERIIKLLEEEQCDCHNVYCDKWATSVLKPLIDLIKGEQ